VIPDCELHLEIEAVRSHGRVWKYKGTAKVNEKRMARRRMVSNYSGSKRMIHQSSVIDTKQRFQKM
jgi:3-hydroxymyristoyl/3-hydroxydecanoyl-(acyl carrier protein) dehydratase